ncbi:helix-turn-helix domain-containing protein [Trinickia sp.]|uniref:helix-turn-helix domain-containing protein n=1 Tax=Trinickia sp. TaxID=2571163 RepID=UPI003F81B775
MQTLTDIAGFLRQQLKNMSITQRELGAEAGLARRTLTGVLSGQADYKVTTLIAVLDRLGYELTFVPKEAAAGLTAQASLAPTTPTVKTRVERARDQVKSPMAVIAPKSGKTE